TAQQPEGISFCFTARPGVVSDRERREAFHKLSMACSMVALKGLDRFESEALLTRVCGPLQEREVGFLCNLTGGNPLFLDEIGRHIRETGLLGDSAVEDIVERLGMPGSLAELLDQSVASLAADHHQVLAAASCIGSQFSLTEVQTLTDL